MFRGRPRGRPRRARTAHSFVSAFQARSSVAASGPSSITRRTCSLEVARDHEVPASLAGRILGGTNARGALLVTRAMREPSLDTVRYELTSRTRASLARRAPSTKPCPREHRVCEKVEVGWLGGPAPRGDGKAARRLLSPFGVNDVSDVRQRGARRP